MKNFNLILCFYSLEQDLAPLCLIGEVLLSGKEQRSFEALSPCHLWSLMSGLEGILKAVGLGLPKG